MTAGQYKWLSRLRDDGPLKRPRQGAYPMLVCIRLGWSEWLQGPEMMERITEKGRVALEIYEQKNPKCPVCGNNI